MTEKKQSARRGPKPRPAERMVQHALKLPPELRDRLHDYSSCRNVPVNRVIVEAIRAYLGEWK